MQKSEDFLRVGAALILAGFLILFLGALFTASQNPGTSQIGGLIMIGPIPIAFGSSPEITTGMLGIGLLIMILYLFIWRIKR